MKPEEIKKLVNEKYSLIARTAQGGGCCGGNAQLDISMIGEEYRYVPGHVEDADLGLGCGVPTQFAGLQPGQSVLDLGSGAGNDCFVARARVGETGQVTGLDFSEEMVRKATANNAKLGYHNVSFVLGDIEQMPFPADGFDLILSNCVLNLVPDKTRAFSEMFRVLKPGGRFCISDVVLAGQLPAQLQKAAEMYAGCVSGAILRNEYLQIIKNCGFANITLHKEREITIPDSVLLNYLSEEEMTTFKQPGSGIFSITVSGSKPA